MAEEAARAEVVAVTAVGTAGLRIARNSDAFVEAVRERTGIEVEIISGDEEARLAYVAVTAEMRLGTGSLVLFDTGGGSSQFTFGQGEQVEERFSVDVGAVRFTERFGLDGVVSEETLARGARRDRGRPRSPRRTSGAGRPRRNRRCGHEPGRSRARARALRPERRPRDGPRPRRGRPPDRALPHAHRGRAPRDPRPPAEARRGDPRRRLRRPDRAREARPRLAHRQRPAACATACSRSASAAWQPSRELRAR